MAEDKVVSPINLADILFAGQWTIMTVYVPPCGIARISVKKKNSGLLGVATNTDGGTYIHIMYCCFGLQLFWRVFLLRAAHQQLHKSMPKKRLQKGGEGDC